MLLLIHLLFARGFISAHPGGRTTSLSKMDWGKTLSSEPPRAADLAFLPLVSRPTEVEAAEQRQRSPSVPAQARPPGRRAGLGTWRRGGLAGPRPGPGPGTAGCSGSRHCQWTRTGWARHADPHGLGASFQSANRSKPRAFGHTKKYTI